AYLAIGEPRRGDGSASRDQHLPDREALERAAPTAAFGDRPRHAEPTALPQLDRELPRLADDPRVFEHVAAGGPLVRDGMRVQLQVLQFDRPVEVHGCDPCSQPRAVKNRATIGAATSPPKPPPSTIAATAIVGSKATNHACVCGGLPGPNS